MAERYGPSFKTLGGRGRVRPGEPGFAWSVCLALTEAMGTALRTAGDIARRAETLCVNRLGMLTPYRRPIFTPL